MAAGTAKVFVAAGHADDLGECVVGAAVGVEEFKVLDDVGEKGDRDEEVDGFGAVEEGEVGEDANVEAFVEEVGDDAEEFFC